MVIFFTSNYAPIALFCSIFSSCFRASQGNVKPEIANLYYK